MKLADYIALLQEIHRQHGDLPVRLENREIGGWGQSSVKEPKVQASTDDWPPGGTEATAPRVVIIA